MDTSDRYYRNLYDFTFELVKSIHFSNNEISERCQFSNIDYLYDLLHENNKIICYSGHFVNYEWLVSFPLLATNVRMGNLYYAGRKNVLTDWLSKIRNRFGAVNIPHKSPIKPLLSLFHELENKKCEGIILGTLADVPPPKTKKKNIHQSPFLGHKLNVYTGSERIGRKYNMTFIYAHISKTKRGFYDITFIKMTPEDVDINPFAFTDAFVKLLEINIREQPDLWMLWGNKKLCIT